MAVYDKNGKLIKSAVNYGWEVDSSDVPKALDMWVEYVGEDNALEDIARAMDDDTLKENVEWIAQQWGIGEEVEEERSAWDKYEKAKGLMGVHELFTNLTQSAGYDELAEDLAYIFRMNDFRQWDDMEVYSSRKSIKSSFNYYDGFEDDVAFHADKYSDDDDIVELVAGAIEEDGHPTESPEEFDSLMRAVQEELKRQGYFKQPWQVNSSKKTVKSSKEEKVNPNDPHMKFKTLDPEHKMDLREDIEDELEALLKKLHVKFDLETWNETVDYILSFFEEDNFYNPKDAKQAVHEWYLDTKDEFPDMFDSKKTKIASSAYREFIHSKMSIKSTHNLIKSSVEEEDPVEVLLKDAAKQLGATYKEGWWGKGIQEGDGRWNGSKWAVVVDNDPLSGFPEIQFVAAKGDSSESLGGVTPMNAKAGPSEPFPKNVVAWIQDKINESNADKGSFEDMVEKFKNVQDNDILYVESKPSTRTVFVTLDTEDEDRARDLAEQINSQVGCDCHYEIYDFYEMSEDKYDDIDPETRDKKQIVFYLG